MALNGSSAFFNEQKNNVITPALRVKLKGNDVQVSGISLSSTDLFTTSDAFYHIDAINYKNHFVLLSTAPSNSNSTQLKAYTSNGSSLYFATLGATIRTGQFVQEGSTLHLYYVEQNRYVRRISTGGLTSWGASTLVHDGATFFSVRDVAAIDGDECYILKGISPTNTNSWRDAYIMYQNTSSGSSRTTNIVVGDLNTDDAPREVVGVGAKTYLTGIRKDGMDYLFTNSVQGRIDLYTDAQGDHIKLFISDTYNVTSKTILFESGSYGAINSTNIKQGPSFYYLSLRHHIYTYIGAEGATYFKDFPTPWAVVKSVDLMNWTGTRFITKLAETPGYESASLYPAFFAGTTNSFYEYGFKGPWNTHEPVYVANAGNSSIDISNDIISYNNTNNQRISLTIRNYGQF